MTFTHFLPLTVNLRVIGRKEIIFFTFCWTPSFLKGTGRPIPNPSFSLDRWYAESPSVMTDVGSSSSFCRYPLSIYSDFQNQLNLIQRPNAKPLMSLGKEDSSRTTEISFDIPPKISDLQRTSRSVETTSQEISSHSIDIP